MYHVNANGTTLYLDGRTLHLNNQWDQTGLFFASDAKAVVSQEVNGDRDEIAYASVREAYSTLSDANNVTTDGLNFQGEIVAVLDANGVAQWVFFYDDHGVTSGTRPNYNDGVKILSMTHSGGVFNVAVATNANVTANNWDVSVYQNNVLVGQSLNQTSGNFNANQGYPLTATSFIGGAASGTYRVEVTIRNGTTVVATGVATFTL